MSWQDFGIAFAMIASVTSAVWNVRGVASKLDGFDKKLDGLHEQLNIHDQRISHTAEQVANVRGRLNMNGPSM